MSSGRDTLTTERLALRMPEPADAETLRDYYVRNAQRFAPWEPARPNELAYYRQWIGDVAREGSERARVTTFLAFRSDASQSTASDLAAVVILDSFSAEEPPFCSISYTVDRRYEGAGYAGEAVRAVVAYAFATLGLGAVRAYYHPDNVRSAKLLERAGFRVVATTPAVPGMERLMRSQVVAERRASDD